MFNTRRGLWGYTGTAPDGEPVTVQSTGMGGPSAAIVAEELIELGARTLVRIGTCGSLVESLRAGDLVPAAEVLAADGASQALGAGERVAADRGLVDALASAAGREPAVVVSSDLFYDRRDGAAGRWRAAGAVAVEMEAAAVLTVAELHGVRAGCLLAVTDELEGGRVRIGDEELEQLGIRLGEVALAALRTR
jgi:uridine phosphorylase